MKELLIYLSFFLIAIDNREKFNITDIYNFSIDDDTYFKIYIIINIIFNRLLKSTLTLQKLINILISIEPSTNNAFCVYLYQLLLRNKNIPTHNPVVWFHTIYINGIMKPTKDITLPVKNTPAILNECKECIKTNCTDNNTIITCIPAKCPMCARIKLELYEHLQYFYYDIYNYIYQIIFDPQLLSKLLPISVNNSPNFK